MHKRAPPKPLSAMDKRIPKNEKYSHIESKLDTGLTINKVKIVTAKEFSQRREEIFYRISKHQLYSLYTEYENDEKETITDHITESINKINISSGPTVITYNEESEPIYSKPYLILDVRDINEYLQYHLLHSKSFPYTMINRDVLISDIYQFKNKEEHLIIICCNDERISKNVAKTLVDRGIDNIFLLTGGIKDFILSYPEFIEGVIPSELLPTKKPGLNRSNLNALSDDRRSVASGRTSHSNAVSPLSNRSSAVRSSYRSSITRPLKYREDRSDAGVSMMSNRSVAESVISQSIARKGKF
mmetsp:Transcript_23500/g.21372  ORF Transcript_23500/g.21372 Transcript_23500/m.21372 type:complete len:301 (+) Transcript_23500:53-955(+)